MILNDISVLLGIEASIVSPGWMMPTPDGVPVLGWMEPLDEAAVAYKRGRILSMADTDAIKRMEEIKK